MTNSRQDSPGESHLDLECLVPNDKELLSALREMLELREQQDHDVSDPCTFRALGDVALTLGDKYMAMHNYECAAKIELCGGNRSELIKLLTLLKEVSNPSDKRIRFYDVLLHNIDQALSISRVYYERISLHEN